MRINSVTARHDAHRLQPPVRPAGRRRSAQRLPGEHLAGPVLQHDGADVDACASSRSTRSTRRAAWAAFASTPAVPTPTTRAPSEGSTASSSAAAASIWTTTSAATRTSRSARCTTAARPTCTARNFGGLLRGATPGTDYAARDTLGRPILRGFGPASRPTGNGNGGYFYNQENEIWYRVSDRFLGSMTSHVLPGRLGHVRRHDRVRQPQPHRPRLSSRRGTARRRSTQHEPRQRRHLQPPRGSARTAPSAPRSGISSTSDLNGKLQTRGNVRAGRRQSTTRRGQQFIVKDVFTLSNTSTNKTATSSGSTIKRMGLFAGANARIQGPLHPRRNAPLRRQLAVRRRQPLGAVRPRLRRVACVGGAVLEAHAHHATSVSAPRAARPATRRRFDAQYETYYLQRHRLHARPGRQPEAQAGNDARSRGGHGLHAVQSPGVEFTHVSSTTKNQILPVPTPATLGFSTQWQNAGTLASKTWEVGAQPAGHQPPRLQLDDARHVGSDAHLHHRAVRVRISSRAGGTGQGTGSFFFMTAQASDRSSERLFQYQPLRQHLGPQVLQELRRSARRRCRLSAATARPSRSTTRVGSSGSARATAGATASPRTSGRRNCRRRSRRGTCRSSSAIRSSIVRCAASRVKASAQPAHSRQLAARLPHDVQQHVTYKRLTVYALLDGTFGHVINNQGEQWGLLDFSSRYFDQASDRSKRRSRSDTAGAPALLSQPGTGGFYDLLGPNNYSVENGHVHEAARSEPHVSRSVAMHWTRRRLDGGHHRPQPVHVHELQRATTRKRACRAATRRSGSGHQPDRRVRLPDASPVHVHSLHALLGAVDT